MTAGPQHNKLLPLVTTVAAAIEDLLLGGLTATSSTTVRILEACFQEAARARLLRLGICLRAAAEELARFSVPNSGFSAGRLQTLLSRAWVLSRAIERAIADKDAALLARLLEPTLEEPCDQLEAVTLGVIPRIVAGSYVAFEFRLRATRSSSLSRTSSLLWSCILPFRKDSAVPMEAYLLMPLKQGFVPALFLERKRVVFSQITISHTPAGSVRLFLGDKSRVSAGEAPVDWKALACWDPAAAVNRLSRHEPSPLDLDTDPEEEVFLENWDIDMPENRVQAGTRITIRKGSVTFRVTAPAGPAEKVFLKTLGDIARAPARPILFGLIHLDCDSLSLEPVSLIMEDGPVPLLADPANLDRKLLLKHMKF